MFTLNSKLNKPLNKRDTKTASKYLDLDNVTVLRNSGLSWHNNVACFSVLHPNTVYICADKKGIKDLIPYIAHELNHRNQFKRWGLLYLVLVFPLWRRWTIEKSSYKEEDRVNNLM